MLLPRSKLHRDGQLLARGRLHELSTISSSRCRTTVPGPIKPENIDAWLNPDPKDLEAMYAILDDRDRPYYEHRMAA
ncbi:hypothetical protein BWU74_12080 [Paraburkholderia caledonica]|nr:hypothetical protein BWU74_12080 [Burkholderia sp. Bk]